MGMTVGAILVSYDINRLHIDVKNAMKTLGYSDNWHYETGKAYQLPNTTLWRSKTTSDQAIADLKGVCSKLNVLLEKAVAVHATEFVGI